MHRQPAFSLVELLIAVAVIGILSTLTVINTNRTRAQARDANRKTSVEAYNTSLEQWRTLSPDKSYFVKMLKGTCATSYTQGYMQGQGTACVGYGGGGAGQVTRKNIAATGNNRGYGPISVADALREAGVLNAVRVDPFDTERSFDDPAARDFILTTCTMDGYAARTPAEALEFTVYAYLELPNTSSVPDQDDMANAMRQCGGENSPETWAFSAGGNTYNYGKGSRRF